MVYVAEQVIDCPGDRVVAGHVTVTPGIESLTVRPVSVAAPMFVTTIVNVITWPAASGMRVLGTLAHEMNRRKARYGLAAICGAWGAGAATIVEREDYWEGKRSFLKE